MVTRVAIALLDELTKKYNNNQVQIHFKHKCTGVNLQSKTAYIEAVDSKDQQKFAINYDILIGADGVRLAKPAQSASQVRNALLDISPKKKQKLF